MGHSLNGFSASQNIKVQNAITLACEATDVASKALTAIKKSNAVSGTFRDFFGPMDAARVDKILQKLNMIQYAMNSSSVAFNRNLGQAGVYATAYRPPSGWSEKSVRQILDKGVFKIDIDDKFYSGRTNDYLSALTIVHEMSHLVANTDDVPLPWNNRGDCYGQANCKRLAQGYPDMAADNADSYGYYVMGEYMSSRNPKMSIDFDPDLSALFPNWTV